MYKPKSTDPCVIKHNLDGRQSLIARTIAYEILGLPHICERCGFEGRVEVHHINKKRDDNRRENLMIFCKSCHCKEHGVIPPKRERTLEIEIIEMLPRMDGRYKLNPESCITKEIRRLETQKYREKWGIV